MNIYIEVENDLCVCCVVGKYGTNQAVFDLYKRIHWTMIRNVSWSSSKRKLHCLLPLHFYFYAIIISIAGLPSFLQKQVYMAERINVKMYSIMMNRVTLGKYRMIIDKMTIVKRY